MITRKAYNSHITSNDTRTEDMGLQAAANMIGVSRTWAYKMARQGKLQVTRKAAANGQTKLFVSKKSVKRVARAI